MTLEEFKEVNKSNQAYCCVVEENVKKLILSLAKIKTYNYGTVEALSVPDIMDVISRSNEEEFSNDHIVTEYFNQINETPYSTKFRSTVGSCLNSFSRTVKIIMECGIQLSPDEYIQVFEQGGIKD